MQRPLLLVVGGAEEREFDHHAPLARLANEVVQPCEVVGRETVEVEFVAAARVTRLVAPRPRRDKPARCRRECVPLDAKLRPAARRSCQRRCGYSSSRRAAAFRGSGENRNPDSAPRRSVRRWSRARPPGPAIQTSASCPDAGGWAARHTRPSLPKRNPAKGNLSFSSSMPFCQSVVARVQATSGNLGQRVGQVGLRSKSTAGPRHGDCKVRLPPPDAGLPAWLVPATGSLHSTARGSAAADKSTSTWPPSGR